MVEFLKTQAWEWIEENDTTKSVSVGIVKEAGHVYQQEGQTATESACYTMEWERFFTAFSIAINALIPYSEINYNYFFFSLVIMYKEPLLI